MSSSNLLTLDSKGYTWPNPNDPKLSGAKFTAVLRAQLNLPASASCQTCKVLGSVHCMHLSARRLAILGARRMRVKRRAKTPRDEPIQVYSCPGRHAYEGADHLGGRSISAPVRGWEGVKEYVPDMCPQCWSETLNEGYRGGRRRWAQDAVTLARKEPRKSKAWVLERRDELTVQLLFRDDDGDATARRKKMKGRKDTGRDRRWKLSKAQEDELRMGKVRDNSL